MGGKKKMAGGEEGKTNRHAIPLALSHFGYSCPELSFLLSLPNFLLLLCDFTGSVYSQNGTNVGGTGGREALWF